MARSRVYQNRKMRTPEGRPAWCLDYVDLDGRRLRVRTTAATKDQATGLLRAKLSEIDRARTLGLRSRQSLTPTTFREFSRDFLEHAKVRVSASSLVRYTGCVNRLLSFFAAMPLASITPGDVERYVVLRRNTIKHSPTCKRSSCGCPRLAPATVNRERAALSNALSMALRRGLVDRNVVLAVKPLKENNARDRYLEPVEETRLLDAVEDWLRPMVILALHTGMRMGELLAIRRADVDRVRRLIRLPKTKNGQIRHVPLNDVAMGVIESVPVGQIGPDGASPFLFVNPETGKPWRKWSVVHAFQRAVAAAGMETEGPNRVTFHTLRHTTVSRLVAAGVPDRKIMKLVGHSSAAMVSRYAHLSPDGLRGAVEALVCPEVSAEKGKLGAQNLVSEFVAVQHTERQCLGT